MNSPTLTPDTSSCNRPALRRSSTRRIVSCPASCIGITPTSLSGLDHWPTPIPDPEAREIITNPLWTWATEQNQSQRQCQLQPQALSTPRSMVSGSRSIHRFGHSDITHLVVTMGRRLELYIWNSQPFMSATDLETVSYAMRQVSKALTAAQYCQIIET